MPIANMLSITSNPFLSMMIWIVLLLATLYFARRPFHRAVGSLAKIIHNAMRLTATSVLSAERTLAHRNREVLIAAGLELEPMGRVERHVQLRLASPGTRPCGKRKSQRDDGRPMHACLSLGHVHLGRGMLASVAGRVKPAPCRRGKRSRSSATPV